MSFFFSETMKRARGTHLKGDDGEGHHGSPYHGEGVLAPEEARVEKADAGNHDPDQSSGGDDPCDVAEVVDGDGARVRVGVLQVVR